ncbi:uncharacterized protein LOC103723258 isoform X1 [Phoenix dactylifera]|uniref:Uncharacterized protein LOC103723258 isoform X1 n=1 Tax=Phoenix dactylifera TaxID=42345 RepID=A0A8B9A3T9_PHODC|nr:uncharacterized protein LOC103723258 isoform X1 [Phoenix dactylifera]
MQAERVRRNGNSFHYSESLMYGYVAHSREFDSSATIPVSSSSLPSSSSSSPMAVKYIEHRVSKMDTLAGVAIKYGVEVADIRRLNGLVTDLQMFAHKSLQIPLPGRHPPSPILSNGSANNGYCREQTPLRQPHIDVLDSFQSLKLKPPPSRISPAMNSLQGYYGLTPPKRRPTPEGTEMAVYKARRSLCLEDESLCESPISDPLHSWNRKSRSVANGFLSENGETEDKIVVEAVDNSEAERSIRRRQKADAHPSHQTPELLLENSSGGFSGRTAKGLALRPKSGSRTDMDMGRPNGVLFGDPLMADGFSAVRKSSSTSNLQDPDNCPIWPTSKWTSKPDGLARPRFDGLPKPIAVRRNKAALD